MPGSPHRFTVSKSDHNGSLADSLLIVVCGVLLAAGVDSAYCRHYLLQLWHTQFKPEESHGAQVEIFTKSATALVLGGILLWFSSRKKATADESLAVVTVYPSMGVQLSEISSTVSKESNGKAKRSTGLFLPRDKIVDCIVYEVILSHKVKNEVAFRIQQPAEETKEGSQSTIQDQDLRLISAFPNTEMTYEECLYMRRHMLGALGLAEEK